MQAEIIRSNRKSLSIEITAEGKVRVRAPRRMKQQEIDRFIQARQKWIEDKMHMVQSRPRAAVHTLQEDEIFWYLGMPYLLTYSNTAHAVQIQQDKIVVPYNTCELMQKTLLQWYKEQAKLTLAQRLSDVSKQTGLTCTGMKITSAKTRWGSCTAKNSLNFSWYLVMAPVQVIDAVVVHELCHTIQHNHSKSFWNEVYRIMPDYNMKHRWLNENSQLLRLEFADHNICYP